MKTLDTTRGQMLAQAKRRVKTMRTIEEIKAEYIAELDKAAETGKETKARSLRAELVNALTKSIPTDRLESICAAERDGRLVEVVRCGECRHYNTTGCSDGCGWCENMDRGVFDEHYCSRGERREKE